MRKPSTVAILSLLFGISLFTYLANRPLADDEANKTHQKWEYRSLYDPAPDALTSAGDKGWEAFAVVQDSTSKIPTFYFKRPKP